MLFRRKISVRQVLKRFEVSFSDVEEEIWRFTGRNNDCATRGPNVVAESFNTKIHLAYTYISGEIPGKIV